MTNLIVGQEITVNWNNQIFNAPAIVINARGDADGFLGQFIFAKLDKPIDLGRPTLQVTVCVRYGAAIPRSPNWIANEAFAK